MTGKSNSIFNALGVLIIIAVGYILITQYIVTQDVNYSIQLKENILEKGVDQLVVFYKINNDLSEEIDSVVLYYWIDEEDPIPEHFPNLDSKKSIQDHLNMYTDNMNTGEHIVYTNLTYRVNESEKSISLSLKFDVF